MFSKEETSLLAWTTPEEMDEHYKTQTPLLTCDDLRTKYGFHFNKEQDAYFESMILAAQRACAAYMDLDSLSAIVLCTEDFELSEGQRVLVLTGSPFRSVESVTLDGEESNFSVSSRGGTVYLPEHSATKAVVKYYVGWAQAPQDVLYCVAMTVQHMSRMANASLVGKTSQSTDGGSESYEQSVCPLAVRTYLDRYRNMRAM